MTEKKKNENWEFGVEKPDEEKPKAKKAQGEKTVKNLLTGGKKKKEKVELAFDKVPKQTRGHRGEYGDNDYHSKGKRTVVSPPLLLRGLAAVVDGGVVYAGFTIVGFFNEVIGVNVAKLADMAGVLSYLDFEYYPLAVHVVAYLILHFFLFCIPLAYLGKTIGKSFFKLRVDDVDAGSLTLKRAFMREIIYKPISIVTVFGILSAFSNKKRRCLHDKLSYSVVKVG